MKTSQRFVRPLAALTIVFLFARTGSAAPPTFTGNAQADFVDPSAVFYNDAPFPDVGMPKPPFALPDISGWDMQGVYLQYDAGTDTMYVGIDCYTVCGDADNNGDPGATGPILASLLGTDNPGLSGTESFAVVFDTTQASGCPDDGAGDVVAGVASVGGADVNDFDIYDYVFPGCADGFFGSGCPFTSTGAFPGNSLLIGGVGLALFADPSLAAPDIEFTLQPFSGLPGFTFLPGGAFNVELNLFAGSIEDDGIGEDEMVGVCFEVTTTTTTTTSTTLCEGPIAEDRCGNGVLDPECNEECDPGMLEICDNMQDDDGDSLVDCADDECLNATMPTCDDTCMLQTIECKEIKDDPAIIYLGSPPTLGFFRLHGRVEAEPGDFDPVTDGFTVELLNANGPIYSGTLLPGDFIPKSAEGGLARRFTFKDKSAKTLGAGSLRNGIYTVNARFRVVDGEPSYTMKLRIYGDFSSATLPQMTTQWYGVGDIGVLTANWTQTGKGWKLTLANF